MTHEAKCFIKNSDLNSLFKQSTQNTDIFIMSHQEGDWITSMIGPLMRGEVVTERDVTRLLMTLMEELNKECNLVLLQSPIVIVGDIHGQLEDLLEMFKAAGEDIDNNGEVNLNGLLKNKYVFLGDYVDRGYFSLDTFLLLVALKIKNRNKITLLRGNHESRQINQIYGFYNEIILNYGHAGLWTICNEAFDLLPVSSLVDEVIFCVHGGLSPSIPLIEKINLLRRQDELPTEGPLADLTWSDPEDVKSWRTNTRGSGYIFGYDQVTKFNRANRLMLICRSHQLVQEGYKYYFGHEEKRTPEGRLLTVWSAPNYTYRSGNKATILKYHGYSRETRNQNIFEIKEFKERETSKRISRPDAIEKAVNIYYC